MLRVGLLIIVLLPGLAWANNGRILYVSGSVTVERGGKLYRAVKNAKVVEGDTINTGSRGRMHIRMSDRTLVSLKPDTNFQIQTYRFDTQRAAPASQRSGLAPTQAQAQQEDRSVFRLVKGGFRAITGLIGNRNRSAFGVSTPVATIGIRGTSFIADLSGGDLDDGSGLALNDPLNGLQLAALGSDVSMPLMGNASMSDADGLLVAQNGSNAPSELSLTVGVADGAVVLTNSQGSLVLENGEFGQVIAGSSPSRLLVPPSDNDDVMQQDGSDDEGDAIDEFSTDTQVATRMSSTETGTSIGGKSDVPPPGSAEEVATEDTEFLSRRNIALASSLDGNANALTLGDGAERLDQNGNVIALITQASRNGSLQAAAAELVGGQVIGGFAPESQLRWGRWSGGQVQLSFADGSTQNVNTSQANLHFIQSVISNETPTMPLSGSQEFVLVGNTDPSSDGGSVGFLGSADLSANFTTQTVDSAVALSVNQQLWEASGSGSIGANGGPANVFSGDYSSVQVDRELAGSGQFSGFFTEQAGAAGLSYRLSQGDAAISGTAAFEAVAP